MPLLDDLILRFSKTTTKFNPSKVLECAIEKAHADMSRRATGHKPEIQVESIAWLKHRFTTNSPFVLTKQTDFDNWHHTTCEDYRNHMNSKGFSFVMTYGRAQKVLNMTFKYLYCTSAYKADVENIISYLHMTLDGYTLRWYKEVVIKYINDNRPKNTAKLKVGDVSDWSKINEVGKHQYIEIQKRIRDYLKTEKSYKYSINTEDIFENALDDQNENKSPKEKMNSYDVDISLDPVRNCPFYAEFIIWEGEIVRAKVENLFKGLNGIYKSWADDKWAVNNLIESELKSKINAILRNI